MPWTHVRFSKVCSTAFSLHPYLPHVVGEDACSSAILWHFQPAMNMCRQRRHQQPEKTIGKKGRCWGLWSLALLCWSDKSEGQRGSSWLSYLPYEDGVVTSSDSKIIVNAEFSILLHRRYSQNVILLVPGPWKHFFSSNQSLPFL